MSLSRPILPTEPSRRKQFPITTGVLDYFPDAMAAVAEVSFWGNEQHNPGQPLHWAREKSADHEDCITRHTLDRGQKDTDGLLHSAKRAWRALAALQIELESLQETEDRHEDRPEVGVHSDGIWCNIHKTTCILQRE